MRRAARAECPCLCDGRRRLAAARHQTLLAAIGPFSIDTYLPCLTVQAERPGDLLDDVAPPVMLVGSSYSRHSEFPQRIGRTRGVDVGTLARDGAGFAGTLDEFLSAPEYRDAKPQVLIWEFPERVGETRAP